MAAFTWSVGGGIEAWSVLAGVRFHRLFADFEAIVRAWDEGMPKARVLYGDDIAYGLPRWAAISYGHLNCLGVPLIFPEDSEVAVRPLFGSLAEGIAALRRPVDFVSAGRFPYYLDLWQRLRDRYPDLEIPFCGFGLEGPLTTAWLLRGHDFWTDLYDDPDGVREYLALVTESVVAYRQCLAAVNSEPVCHPDGTFLVDDGAAMVPPRLWPIFVLPFLERYFSALTTGRRGAHIEALVPAHLPYLDVLRLDAYDPSVSPALTPRLIREHCAVDFTWRFNEIEGATYTTAVTEQWVVDAVRAGAPGIRSGVGRNNVTPAGIANTRAFIAAARRVAAQLAAGRAPADVV